MISFQVDHTNKSAINSNYCSFTGPRVHCTPNSGEVFHFPLFITVRMPKQHCSCMFRNPCYATSPNLSHAQNISLKGYFLSAQFCVVPCDKLSIISP